MGYVLKLCGWYPSRTDALSGDFVQRQAIAISKYCKTVVLFAQKDPQIKSNSIELEVLKKGDLFEYIYYYPERRLLDKLWSQWYYLRILKMFLSLLKKEHGDPTLVHVNIVWRVAIWALYLKKKFNWPFVITENSTEYQLNALENIRDKSRWRKMITKKAFKKSQLFIPVSKQLGKVVSDLYGSLNFKVVPNTVDTSLFYYEPLKEPRKIKRLLHISTMGYQKNIEGILRVIEQLAKSDVAFEIVLVGPVSEPVRKAVNNIENLKDKVTLTGAVSYETVAGLLRNADGLFLFSRYENLPCVILEALCCGVPVISTNVGGIQEVITEQNGILVRNEDEAGLLQALTDFIEGRVTFDREEIANNAAQLYSYKKVGKMFFDIYLDQFPSIDL